MNKEIDEMNYGPALESSETALNWLSRHNNQFGHFINGKMTSPKDTFQTINPSDLKVLAKISKGNITDVDNAVKSAKQAFKSWKKIKPFERSKYLYALARLIQKNSRILAVLETLDNGKPIRETRDLDIPLVVRHFYYHAGWAKILTDKFPRKKPIGVIGQIIPWNFPLLMLSWKIAPALATGNTVVLKPAETTPLTAMFFAELCIEAKIPPGVINIVNGDGETGSLIINNDKISKIAFTGSTDVGRFIRKETAGKNKKLTLELGGKSAFIVFDDADLDSAVEGVVDSIWLNQGEVCCAGSRLLVQEGIKDRFIAKLKRRMSKLRLGDPLDKSTDIGAINSLQQLKRIKSLVISGTKEGAIIYQPKIEVPKSGYYYPPTLLENTNQSMNVCQTEIFGPVLSVMPFRTPKEAVSIANNSKYGLSSSVWTENINLGLDIAPKIKVGVVWINSTNMFDASSGFGGFRESGFGREGGEEGLLDYLTYSDKIPNTKTDKKKIKKIKINKNSTINIDRTRKLYIGGAQKRSDSGYDKQIYSSNKFIGQVPLGNRKDIRDAVEAAANEKKWKDMSAHGRAQVLYYAAENLELRKQEFAQTIFEMTGENGKDEVEKALETIFYFASWTDKFEGAIHNVPIRGVSLAMKEPLGIIAIICPDNDPLLSFIHLVFSALSMGNTVVVVPSEKNPLCATDMYQIFETSDFPSGSVNIVTGNKDELSETLAMHMQVDGIWYFGSQEGSKKIEENSISNLKQTWVNNGISYSWSNLPNEIKIKTLHKSTQIKNIWIPYGE
tara:strand:+ start:2670 stop:5024 length:2355 start_codon:yes stop_codon:yes gene_type:complete